MQFRAFRSNYLMNTKGRLNHDAGSGKERMMDIVLINEVPTEVGNGADEIIRLRTENARLAEGRCDALQKDADRYRWLRMHTDWFDWDIVVQPHLPADHPAHDYFEVKIDCAIDFVMGNLK